MFLRSVFDRDLADVLIIIALAYSGIIILLLYLNLRARARAGGGTRGQAEPSEGGCDHETQLKKLHDELEKLEERVGLLERGAGAGDTCTTGDKPAIKGKQRQDKHLPVQPAGVPLPAAFEKLRCLYNDGVDDPSRRQEFREVYDPIRIRTSNAMERRRNVTLPAEFRTASEGDFYAVRIEGLGDSQRLVVPRFDLTFEESSVGPGAMGDVFNFSSYDQQARYSHVKLVRAAIFRPDGDRGWALVQKGQLELGTSD